MPNEVSGEKAAPVVPLGNLPALTVPDLGQAPLAPEGSEHASAERLVLKLGRALHRYGVPAHQLEQTLIGVCRMFSLQGQFFSLPTAVLAFFGPLGDQRAGALRLEPGEIDLSKLVRLDDTVKHILAGKLSPARGVEVVEAIEQEPPYYGALVTTIALAASCACGARLFGGGLVEIIASGIIGLVLALLVTAFSGNSQDVKVPVCASVAALLSQLGTLYVPYATDVVTLSSLLSFLPGLTLTVAATELATRNFTSGAARLTLAALVFFQLVFGVALGTTLGQLAPVQPVSAAFSYPWWVDTLAAAGLTLSFVVLFRARLRDAGWMALAAVIALTGSRMGAKGLGPELGAWVGAMGVGIGANLYSRIMDRPASVFMMVGIVLLVPGSLGLRSFTWMLQEQTLLGASAMFRTILVAIALATGILTANVVVRPRSTL